MIPSRCSQPSPASYRLQFTLSMQASVAPPQRGTHLSSLLPWEVHLLDRNHLRIDWVLSLATVAGWEREREEGEERPWVVKSSHSFMTSLGKSQSWIVLTLHCPTYQRPHVCTHWPHYTTSSHIPEMPSYCTNSIYTYRHGVNLHQGVAAINALLLVVPKEPVLTEVGGSTCVINAVVSTPHFLMGGVYYRYAYIVYTCTTFIHVDTCTCMLMICLCLDNRQ